MHFVKSRGIELCNEEELEDYFSELELNRDASKCLIICFDKGNPPIVVRQWDRDVDWPYGIIYGTWEPLFSFDEGYILLNPETDPFWCSGVRGLEVF